MEKITIKGAEKIPVSEDETQGKKRGKENNSETKGRREIERGQGGEGASTKGRK